jgi:DNA-binding CsgD family transcriptional regulator
METHEIAAATLSLLRVGVVLLASDGRVVSANRSAQRAIRRGDALFVVENRLRARDPRESGELGRLVAQAAEQASAALEASIALSRASGGRPLALVIRPLAADATTRGCVAVFICDPEQEADAETETLVRLYRLTTAEARVARALVRGRTLEEAARQFRVSVHTARIHLKHALAKTESRRQSDLVRLLMAGPAMLRIA